MKKFVFLLAVAVSFPLFCQNTTMDTLPYYEIPESPEDYGPGNVISRMIDGLGYRYYWATDSLTQTDLDFKPSQDARTTFETLQHLYGLSETIVNAPQNKTNVRPMEMDDMDYQALRKQTLENLKKASELFLGKTAAEIADFKIKFQSDRGNREFPYWNMINGPIADAIYHTGQIVSFRRASGNPIHPGVSVFIGKTRTN